MRTKAHPLTRLCEQASPAGRVDRDAGIIYGVKVLGRTSPNSHGVKGAEGTEYSNQAWQDAARLCEGAKVNADHPPRNSRDQERKSLDRFGWLENLRIEEDGPRADLHLLLSHPLAAPVMEAAQKNPALFGLSINAWGRGEVKGGRYVVEEILEVRSVDVVADGATVAGLFESQRTRRRRRRMTTVRDILESILRPAEHSRLALLEGMDYGCSDKHKLMEQPADDAGMMDEPPPPPPDMGAPAGGGTLEDSLSAAVVAVLNDETMDKGAKRKKILGILNLLDDSAAGGGGSEEAAPVEENEEEDKKESLPSDEADVSPEKAKKILKDGTIGDKALTKAQRGMFGAIAGKESRGEADHPELVKLREENAALRREKDCRKLCEAEHVKLHPTQLKAMQLLETEQDRRAYLAECRSAGSRPRTQAPLREGRHSIPRKESDKEWLARLTGCTPN